jgi:hypothetical protein
MKKHITICITILIVFLFSCRNRSTQKEILVHNDQFQSDYDNQDTTTYSAKDLLKTSDSAYLNDKNKVYYEFALNKLIDTEQFRIPKYLGTDQFLKFIKVYDFNKARIVLIDYNPQMGDEYSLGLFVVDSLKRILSSLKFQGCHYNNGEISIGDFDLDSIDEVFFKISAPMQSVPVITIYHEYYKFIDNKLKPVFSVVADKRDGRTQGGEYGTQTIRKYEIYRDSIKVIESEYHYNPDNFEFEAEIKPKRKVEENTQLFIFSTDSSKYVKK